MILELSINLGGSKAISNDAVFKPLSTRPTQQSPPSKACTYLRIYVVPYQHYGTVRSETVRLLFSILAETDYEFQSADVRTAFLHGEVPANQDIYMSRPTGLTDEHMPEKS